MGEWIVLLFETNQKDDQVFLYTPYLIVEFE